MAKDLKILAKMAKFRQIWSQWIIGLLLFDALTYILSGSFAIKIFGFGILYLIIA